MRSRLQMVRSTDSTGDRLGKPGAMGDRTDVSNPTVGWWMDFWWGEKNPSRSDRSQSVVKSLWSKPSLEVSTHLWLTRDMPSGSNTYGFTFDGASWSIEDGSTWPICRWFIPVKTCWYSIANWLNYQRISHEFLHFKHHFNPHPIQSLWNFINSHLPGNFINSHFSPYEVSLYNFHFSPYEIWIVPIFLPFFPQKLLENGWGSLDDGLVSALTALTESTSPSGEIFVEDCGLPSKNERENPLRSRHVEIAVQNYEDHNYVDDN